MKRFAVLSVFLLLAACNQSAPPPAASVAQPQSASLITPAGFKLPEGTGCAGDIARFRAVQDNDLQTGHVNKAVHTRIGAEIDQAASLCSAGNDAGARGALAGTKKRFGYPG